MEVLQVDRPAPPTGSASLPAVRCAAPNERAAAEDSLGQGIVVPCDVGRWRPLARKDDGMPGVKVL